MTERINMSREEAVKKVDELQELVDKTYDELILNHPFMLELAAGTLSMKQIRGWLLNHYTFAVEVNTSMTSSYHRFIGFFKRHRDLDDIFTTKISGELSFPGTGGHAREFIPVAEALGVDVEEMVNYPLIPEARMFVDYEVRTYTEAPLGECFASHLAEKGFGKVADAFGKSLITHYGLKAKNIRYFNVHEEFDLGEHAVGNKLILIGALEDGYGSERAGWNLDYAAKVSVEALAIFFDGIYKRYKD